VILDPYYSPNSKDSYVGIDEHRKDIDRIVQNNGFAVTIVGYHLLIGTSVEMIH